MFRIHSSEQSGNPLYLPMKPRPSLQLLAAITALSAVSLAPLSLHAANATWSGATDGTWATGNNWSPTAAPGSTTVLNTADDATFNNNVNTTITIDANRNIDRIIFDTSAGAFTIGSASANAGNALNLTSGSVIQYASTFAGAATAQTFNAPILLQGTAQFQNLTGTAVGNTNTLQFNGNISGGTSSGLTLTLSGNNVGASNVISSVISNGASSGVGLTKTAGATWTLSGTNNSFTGGLSVTQGNLRVNTIAASGSNSSIGAGSTITLAGSTNPQTVFSIVGAGGTTNRALSISSATTNHSSIDASGSGAAILNGTFASTGASAPTLILTGSSASNIQNEINSNIANGTQTVSVSKTGSNVWRLGGTNSYTGNTTVNGAGGTLLVSGTGSTNTGAYNVTNGTLAGIGTNAFGNTSGINIAGLGILSLRGDSSTAFTKTTGGAAITATATANGATFNVDQATSSATAKTMTIGVLALNTAVTNQTNFTGANNTSLTTGEVTTGNSTSGTETINNTNIGGGTLTFASLAVNRTGTPTVAFTGNGSTTVSGAITEAAVTKLTKSGSGVLTLGGNNSYTGTTTVSAGTFLVNGSIGAGAVTVSGTGTALGGTGSIAGATTLQVGTFLAPGASPGVLSFGSTLNLAASAGSNFEVNGLTRGTEFDGVNTTGLLTYGGALSISFGSAFLNGGGTTLDLFNLTTQSGNFSSVSIAGAYVATLTNNSGAWTGATLDNSTQFAFTQSTGDLVVTAIPEPSGYVLFVGVGMLGFTAVRRRRPV